MDLVQGSRFFPGGHCENTPLDRTLGIRYLIAPLMSRASGFHYSDPTNGFKGLCQKLLSNARLGLLREELTGFNFQFYLNYRAPGLGFRVEELPVSRVYPKTGPTPTKIVGLRPRLKLLKEFFKTIAGSYNLADHDLEGHEKAQETQVKQIENNLEKTQDIHEQRMDER